MILGRLLGLWVSVIAGRKRTYIFILRFSLATWFLKFLKVPLSSVLPRGIAAAASTNPRTRVHSSSSLSGNSYCMYNTVVYNLHMRIFYE